MQGSMCPLLTSCDSSWRLVAANGSPWQHYIDPWQLKAMHGGTWQLVTAYTDLAARGSSWKPMA